MLLATSGVFFSIQLGEAFYQRGTWPFSTFSMYSEALIVDHHEILFEITLKNQKVFMIAPLHELPIDYYKALIFMRKTFYEKNSPFYEKKDTYIRMYLDWNDILKETELVKVYSVPLKDIRDDNYDWDGYTPVTKPIYTYRAHEN